MAIIAAYIVSTFMLCDYVLCHASIVFIHLLHVCLNYISKMMIFFYLLIYFNWINHTYNGIKGLFTLFRVIISTYICIFVHDLIQIVL